MSATAAREANESNPYDSAPGGGAGGKFRKKPYRKSHTTPYDRPLSSIRNLSSLLPSFGHRNGNDNGNDGWLRRIVDPAQRLVTASAYRLFASFFRKRLTQPPPQPSGQEGRENQQEAVATRSLREPEIAVSEVQKATSSKDGGSFVELEEILKRKTFSKSEIDHLTALLHAKGIDSSVANEVKKPQAFSSGLHNLQEGSSSVVRKADGNENQLPTTHVNVHGGDVRSPAELAKAYMGSRPLKVAPSAIASRPQAFREDSISLASSQETPKLPVMSIVPRSSDHRGVRENGYATPRSRGRSAIYSMARTPYARVHHTPLKIFEPMSKGIDGKLVAHLALEQGRVSESNALKRRSSIFENDIGSVGPSRRIRHKPNLLSQKNRSLLASASAAGRTPLPSTELNHRFMDQSIDSEGVAIPSRNVSSISSKSTEIASKILQQLDKIVSPPKEKSSIVRLASTRDEVPVKLSPSDLRGQALKSLEHIDSTKFLEIARGSSQLDDSVGTSTQDSGASALQKSDKVEQNGPLIFGFDGPPPATNHFEGTAVDKLAVLDDKVVDSGQPNCLAVPSSAMNQTFKMSMQEDYLDLDDDDQQNEAVSTTLVEEGDKLDSATIRPVITAEADAKDEYVPVSDVHVPTLGLKKRRNVESPNNVNSGEKTAAFNFASIPSTSKNVEPDVQVAPLNQMSDTSTSEREPGAISFMFTAGKKLSSADEGNPASPVFASSLNNGSIAKDVEKVPQFSFASSSSFNGSSTAGFASQSLSSESCSSFSTVSAGSVPFVTKATELTKVDDKKDPKAGVLETSMTAPLPASTTSSTASLFSFGVPAAVTQPASSLAVESNASPPERPFGNFPVVASSRAGASDGKLSPSQSASTFSVQAPMFKFGSVTSTPLEVSAVAPIEVKTKVDSGSGNAVENPFSGSSSANTSALNSVFGFSAAAAASNGATSDNQGSVSFGVSNGISQVQASTSSSGLSSSTQSASFQFGPSGPSFSFGLAGNANASSGKFAFGSSSAVTFPTGTSVGVTSSQSSGSAVVSSSSSSTTNLFGSLQTTASPVFGTLPSTTSPSTGFSFGASSSSSGPITFGANAASSSSGSSLFGSLGTSFASNGPSSFVSSGSLSASITAPIFGSTASTSTLLPTFAFGSSTASSSPSQPIFGNSNPVFAFGLAPSGNNDQMNTEDTMAEDTAVPAVTPPATVFGQQPISPVPPSSNFMFGSGTSPFQFGGQQNMGMPSNPSPFAASGSLDFNASGGGSFSLGTGGGDKSARKIIKVKHRQRRK